MSEFIKGIGNAANGGLQSGIGGLVGGLIQAPLQMGLQAWGARKQYKYNKMLQEQAAMHNNWLAEQSAARNYMYGLKMFNATGYEAQKAQMKAAGLNPALMYQSGGQTGTTSNPSSGSAEGVNAQGMNALSMNIASNPSVAQTAADINLKNAQADEIRSRIPRNEAETDLKKAEKDAQIAYKGYLDAENHKTWQESFNVAKEGEKLIVDIANNKITYRINSATEAEQVTKVLLMNQSIFMGTMLAKSNIELNEYHKYEITSMIAQGWQKLANDAERIEIEWKNATTMSEKNAIFKKYVNGTLNLMQDRLNFDKDKWDFEKKMEIYNAVLDGYKAFFESMRNGTESFKNLMDGGTKLMDLIPTPRKPIGFHK